MKELKPCTNCNGKGSFFAHDEESTHEYICNACSGTGVMEPTLSEALEDLRKHLKVLFFEICKALRIDKLANWLNSKLTDNGTS